MILNSAEYGKIEINADDIIYFKEGLYGFEDIKEYVLINHDDEGSIISMQSVHSKFPSFILLDPFSIYNGYNPMVNKKDLKSLMVTSTDDLKFLVIAVISTDFKDSVVNLKSPIAINPNNKNAKQIILENNAYPVRYELFKNK